MPRAVSSIETSPGKPRKTATRLTKARKVELLKQGIAAEEFFGSVVRLQLADDSLCSTDLVAAANARTGKTLRLFDFFRSGEVQEFLRVRAKKTGKRVFSDDLGEGPFLVKRPGKGGVGWVERVVGLKLAAWADTELEEAVYAFVMAAHDQARKPHRPKRSAEQKLLQAQRGQAHRSLTDVLQSKGVQGAEYQRVLRQVTFLLTGHAPEHWQKELEAKDWLSRATPEFQRGMVLVRQTLAGHYRRLDLASRTEGKVRWFNLEAKEVMPELLELLTFWGLPRNPLPDGQTLPPQVKRQELPGGQNAHTPHLNN